MHLGFVWTEIEGQEKVNGYLGSHCTKVTPSWVRRFSQQAPLYVYLSKQSFFA